MRPVARFSHGGVSVEAQGIIFDMDGTLLDSIHVWHEAEDQLMRDVNIELTKEERDELNTLTLDEAGAFFNERFGVFEDPQEVIDAIMTYMMQFYSTNVCTKPGAEECVRRLYEANIPLCLLSSSPKSFILQGMETTGLKKYFEPNLLISAEDQGLAKRKTSTFKRVADMMNLECSDLLLLDDSWYALEAGKESGVSCIGVYSLDSCGSHEELGRYSSFVVDDFLEVDVEIFHK